MQIRYHHTMPSKVSVLTPDDELDNDLDLVEEDNDEFMYGDEDFSEGNDEDEEDLELAMQ